MLFGMARSGPPRPLEGAPAERAGWSDWTPRPAARPLTLSLSPGERGRRREVPDTSDSTATYERARFPYFALIFDSVPFRRRRTFARCVHTMNAGTTVAKIHTGGGFSTPSPKCSASKDSGSESAARIDPSET